MIAFLGLFLLVVGAGIAYAAQVVPARRIPFERCGGTMLIAGLMMIGASLPFVG